LLKKENTISFACTSGDGGFLMPSKICGVRLNKNATIAEKIANKPPITAALNVTDLLFRNNGRLRK
jgi:hypothetical protein